MVELLVREGAKGPTVAASRLYALSSLNRILGIDMPFVCPLTQQKPIGFPVLAHLQKLLEEGTDCLVKVLLGAL
eukprot:12428832-Karenia_brevis.AAC.1